MTETWTPGTWWRAPPSERRFAYYKCMRECYQMPAAEALAYVNARYPEVKDLIEDMRVSIGKHYITGAPK